MRRPVHGPGHRIDTPEPRHPDPVEVGPRFPPAGHRVRHLLLDMAAKQEMRLHDDPAHAPVRQPAEFRDRLGQRRSGGRDETNAQASGRQRHVVRQRGPGELQHLSRRRGVARTAAHDQQPRGRRILRADSGNRLRPPGPGQGHDLGMEAEGRRLERPDADRRRRRRHRLGHVAERVPGREQQQRRHHHLAATAAGQLRDRLVNRRPHEFEEPEFHRHARQQTGGQRCDPARLGGADLVRRAVPHDQQAAAGRPAPLRRDGGFAHGRSAARRSRGTRANTPPSTATAATKGSVCEAWRS
jgi:hypothetical protein